MSIHLRLTVYILSIISIVTLGYLGIGVLIILWLYSKEGMVILLGGALAFLSLGASELSGYQQFEVTVSERLGSGTIIESDDARLYWPKSEAYLGCKVKISGIAYFPSSPSNPGGFDQRKWLKRHGIASVFKANSVTKVHCRMTMFQSVYKIIHQWLERLDVKNIAEIESILFGSFGKKNHYWYGLGVIHFLSISGFHINRLYGFGCCILKSTFTKRSSQLISMLLVSSYVVFIGLPFCALRALIMLILTLYPLSNMERYLIALATMLSLDPLAVMDLGAWLSFVAVLILMFCDKDREYYLFLSLSLVSYAFEIEIQPLSILANNFLAPFFINGVFPLMLIGMFPGFFDISFSIIDQLFTIMIELMKNLTSLHIPPLFYTWDKVVSVIALILLRYCFFAPRWLLLCLFIQYSPSLKEGEFKLSVLSVGHGLSVLISTKNHHLLYDIGSSHIQDITHQVVLPFLNKERISKLDAVVISHPDHDHYSGLEDLLRDRRVDNIWVSIPITTYPQKLCQAGISWEWDGVAFAFIHPDQNDLWQDNNQSCVLKVSSNHKSVLLTGDIEKKAEIALLNSEYSLSSDVLIAPHHGSHTSSHHKFLQAISPKTIIISEHEKRIPKDRKGWVKPFYSEVLS